MKMRLMASVLLLAGMPLAVGQSLESEYRRKGSAVRDSFEEIRAQFGDHAAVLYGWRDGEDGADEPETDEEEAGTIVAKPTRRNYPTPQGYAVVASADGYLLAKASEVALINDLEVVVGKKRFKEIEKLGIDQNWDVILLKVAAADLAPVQWQEAEPAEGTIVFSNSGTSRFKRRAQMGIISANAREIGGEGLAVLGVSLQGKDELTVDQISEKSGAAAAGIEKGDVVLSMDGEPVGKADEFMDRLKDKLPGDRVKLGVRRGDEELELEVEMLARSEVYPEQLTRNDAMSGEFSKRRTNFPRVIQHDTPMARRTVGGPLLNMKGECVGMNIAFATREASYAIPAKEARELFEKLKGE